MMTLAAPKQHLSADGTWRRCRASVRACKYAQHRELEAEHKSAVLAHAAAATVSFALLGNVQQDHYRSDGVLRVAPESCSGKYCPDCGRYITRAELAKQGEQDAYTCPECAEISLISEMPTDLREDQLQFTLDSAVMAASWFHISQRANWDADTKAAEVVTHLGSKEAAMERMSHIMSSRPDPKKLFYLHEVRLSESTGVKPGIWHDQTYWPEEVGIIWAETDGQIGVADKQVQRYMNFYEGPGTISLLADPNSYTLVTSLQIPTARVK